MAGTRLAFALAGLGGFNAHGAGFLQAARDNEMEPDLVTATSGPNRQLPNSSLGNFLDSGLGNALTEAKKVINSVLYGP